MDIDMAILAAPPQRYAAYARQVRREYGHVPSIMYCYYRSRFLSSFASSDLPIFARQLRCVDANAALTALPQLVSEALERLPDGIVTRADLARLTLTMWRKRGTARRARVDLFGCFLRIIPASIADSLQVFDKTIAHVCPRASAHYTYA